MFTRVREPERVLDDICRRIDLEEKSTGQRVTGDHLGLPYWAELWDSAIGISTWIVKNNLIQRAQNLNKEHFDLQHTHIKSIRVLDLGCGMGLTGTVAALLGADVTFGDIETDCLLFSQLNGQRVSCEINTRRIDWQRDTLKQQFDFIIGSDVLYDRMQWPHLDRFFRAHLAPQGTILLGEPGRQTGELFIPWIQNAGWQFHRHEQCVPTRELPIRLFLLTK
jgi:predicted nicotinamide N-methyase